MSMNTIEYGSIICVVALTIVGINADCNARFQTQIQFLTEVILKPDSELAWIGLQLDSSADSTEKNLSKGASRISRIFELGVGV